MDIILDALSALLAAGRARDPLRHDAVHLEGARVSGSPGIDRIPNKVIQIHADFCV